MHYVDYKYLRFLSSRLDKFKDNGNHVYSFRCPICGDSQKDKRKTRGYLLYDGQKGNVRFFCHNCGASSSFSSFLKNIAPDLYGPYKIEMFGKALGSKKEPSVDEKFKATSTDVKQTFGNPLSGCHKLSKCPETLNMVKEYAEWRQIPLERFDKIYAAKNASVLTAKLDKYKDHKFPDVPVLVIPFFTKDGSYSYIQCRVADRDFDEDFRFITLQIDDENPKLYGLDSVNWNNPVYVLEGPIDATLVDNGVANAGASSSSSFVVQQIQKSGNPISNVCMLFDNDYKKNAQILDHVKKCVDGGFSVVLFDSEFDGIKDVDEAVMHHGWTRKEVNDYVRRRTFSGLRAKLELSTIGKRK